MKRIFTILVATVITVGIFQANHTNAQTPEKISYQAVLRNNSNQLLIDQPVGMKISILKGAGIYKVIYVETHNTITNDNGLVTVEIGGGTVMSGDFSAINWAEGPYHIRTATDPAGGTDYTIIGTSQLLSVPYALYAKTSEIVTGTITETDPVFSVWDKDYNDLMNKPNIKDSVLTYVNGSETKLSAGKNITITGSGTTVNPYFIGSSGFTHYIGEIYGGGIVVAVWKVGSVEKGLIASLTDISAGAIWSNITTEIGSYAQGLINGTINTNAIITQSGHTESAAKLCDDYINTDMGTGVYSDWYLPAAWELDICFNAAFIVNTILGGADGFRSTYYWNSTENGEISARSQNFFDGSKKASYKAYDEHRVRAVRRFHNFALNGELL